MPLREVSPEFLSVRNWPLAGGRIFSPSEVDYAAKVCVLGQTVAGQLFGEAEPVGETIRVQKIPCEVIGLLAPKGQSPVGQDQDDVLLMPYTTVQRKVKGVYWLDDILCVAVSPAVVAEAEEQISALLRERHHLIGDREPDFNLRHPADVARAGVASQRIMTLLLASIASVALVVGGIGIMNIMLVSVGERTREIGLRLAVGARSRDVLFQFLTEAVTLSVIGGGVGIGLGLAGAYGIAYLAAWRTLIRPDAVVLALGFAAAVGIGCGFYPARQAARLDPVDALGR